jgi:protein TonB
MRKYTLVFSVAAHIVGACAVVIVPLFANDVLPDPRHSTEFIRVVPFEPPKVQPPPVARPLVAAADPSAAPLVAPSTIAPEPAMSPNDAAPLTGVGAIDGIGDSTALISEPPPSPPARLEPVRVGGDIRPPMKIADAAPVYPAIARAARVEGVVILEAMIGEDGGVREVRVLRSIPLLDAAAVDAVRQWRFTPTLLNGQAVPIVMTVTVAFRLR